MQRLCTGVALWQRCCVPGQTHGTEILWMQARRSEEARVEEGQSGIERRKLYRIYTETILTKWNINYKLHSSGY